MPRPDLGLSRVSTDDLKKALRALHRGEIQAPLTIQGLTGTGLQDTASDLLGQLRGLEAAAVRAVLVCVLAERAATGGRPR